MYDFLVLLTYRHNCNLILGVWCLFLLNLIHGSGLFLSAKEIDPVDFAFCYGLASSYICDLLPSFEVGAAFTSISLALLIASAAL